MKDKLQPTHLARRAIVYLRQSTFRQVHDNHESTVRQYALGRRALALGWPAERVQIVDEDLGRSGTTTQSRSGFQRLVDDVVQGRVGAIFALEVSRLSRSSADWHRLLDLCSLTDVVIIDEERVYAPDDPDDRTLLGFKGTMSEAEERWMRLRLLGARVGKAQRGELHMTPATGYVWDAGSARFQMDPDERVRHAIQLVFDRFRVEGSAHGVLMYLERERIQMPAYDKSKGYVCWGRPSFGHILDILHNPIYAGAYVYGRHLSRMRLVDGNVRRRTTKVSESDWKACLRDHHPAYISWEEFVANQHKLRENRANASPGAAREGSALLQGLAVCGRCGRRMSPEYHPSRAGGIAYVCQSLTVRSGAGHRCWTVSGRAIDDATAQVFLEAMDIPDIELSLAVVRETERQAQEVARQWALRRERLAYEARLAERRYKAVDPDNRVIARTLEREWNDKLTELEQLETDYQTVQRAHKLDLSEADRALILSLARDLPRVWTAPTTTHAERKNLLRILVKEVVLSPIEAPARSTRIQVVWKTGAVTEVTVPRPRTRAPMKARPEVVERIRVLVAEGKSDAAIADDLNSRGLRTLHDRTWTWSSVYFTRTNATIKRTPAQRGRRHPSPLQRSDGLYSIRGVAAELGVTVAAVQSWVNRGRLRSRVGGGAGRARWFKLDQATVLRLKKTPKARTGRLRRGGRPHARGSSRKGGAS
jgi:DNA invertase Pin-like site-specific DNA recombinase